ncbi:hypothetical protein K488DRAFT_65500, partial [Vararia minispora EC-137]
ELTKTISVGDGLNKAVYKLKGIVYSGQSHFTCRFLNRSGHVFYHDGMTTGRRCVYESNYTNLTDPHHTHNKFAYLAIYSRL